MFHIWQLLDTTKANLGFLEVINRALPFTPQHTMMLMLMLGKLAQNWQELAVVVA